MTFGVRTIPYDLLDLGIEKVFFFFYVEQQFELRFI